MLLTLRKTGSGRKELLFYFFYAYKAIVYKPIHFIGHLYSQVQVNPTRVTIFFILCFLLNLIVISPLDYDSEERRPDDEKCSKMLKVQNNMPSKPC